MAWSRGDPTTAGGDVSTPDLLLEHKRTVRASLAVRREWLDKVREGAQRAMKEPGMVLTFEEPGKPPDDWILLPLAVAKRRMGL